MGETILRIKLSELKTIRIVCKKCGTVVEFPTERAGARYKGWNGECRDCKTPFVSSKTPEFEGFAALSAAFENLTNVADMEVEFIIPDEA